MKFYVKTALFEDYNLIKYNLFIALDRNLMFKTKYSAKYKSFILI